MDDSLLATLTDLGGTLASLGFAGWLIVHLLKLQTQKRERERWRGDVPDGEFRPGNVRTSVIPPASQIDCLDTQGAGSVWIEPRHMGSDYCLGNLIASQ